MRTTSEKQLLFLSLEDVIACGGTDVATVSQDIQRGFELLLEGKLVQPAKTTLKPKSQHEHSTGLVNFLPALIHLEDDEVIGCKALGAMPSNVDLGLPRATGLILLFEAATKSPLCIMDAQAISATRTGAVSLLAARKLADPGVRTIGMVGAGVNMRTQLLGLQHALPALSEVKVYSRGESKHRFAREMGERTGLNIRAVESAEEAVRDSELYVTCLPNVNKPAVKAEWVKKRGVTVINIGCYENEASLLTQMDRVVSDLWEHGKHRGVQTHAIAVSQGLFPDEKVEDLGPILTGQVPGRQSQDENIFFCPTGLGFEDVLVAWRVYNEAIQKGVGTSLNLWRSPQWI